MIKTLQGSLGKLVYCIYDGDPSVLRGKRLNGLHTSGEGNSAGIFKIAERLRRCRHRECLQEYRDERCKPFRPCPREANGLTRPSNQRIRMVPAPEGLHR